MIDNFLIIIYWIFRVIADDKNIIRDNRNAIDPSGSEWIG